MATYIHIDRKNKQNTTITGAICEVDTEYLSVKTIKIL